MLDPDRFPSLHAYLSSLPNGIDSYPACQSKASLVHSAVDRQDVDAIAEGLPTRLAQLIRNPPPVGVWLPAVHADATFHAVCDRVYTTDEAMIQWCYDRTIAMAQSSLYRALMRVSGPRILFKMSLHSHRLFQRGTEVVNEVLESNRIVMRMTFPPFLHSRLNQLSNVPLLQAMAELTGGRDVRAEMLVSGKTEARYECVWR